VLLDHSSKATARSIWTPASPRRSIKNKILRKYPQKISLRIIVTVWMTCSEKKGAEWIVSEDVLGFFTAKHKIHRFEAHYSFLLLINCLNK